MDVADLRTIPARRAVADRVAAHRHVTVVNTHGSQVVDSWADMAPTNGVGAIPTDAHYWID